jgi:hypothetical protein
MEYKMDLQTKVQSKGRLDNLVIYRFALIRKNIGGGIEEHLNNVNRLLLERNNITIIQTYLNSLNDVASIKVEQIGRGRLIWIPLKRYKNTSTKKPCNLISLLKIWPWFANNSFFRLSFKPLCNILSKYKKKIGLNFMVIILEEH